MQGLCHWKDNFRGFNLDFHRHFVTLPAADRHKRLPAGQKCPELSFLTDIYQYTVADIFKWDISTKSSYFDIYRALYHIWQEG